MKIQRQCKIDVPNHCSERWDGMKNHGENKNCLNCKRTVYDFTQKSDLQIYEFLKSTKEKRICGRFTSSQLNRPLRLETSIFRNSIRFLLPTIFILGINEAKAINSKEEKIDVPLSQSITKRDSIKITGKVVDSDTKEPLMYANVGLLGTKLGIATSKKGQFELTIPSESLNASGSLVISYIGYKTKKLKINAANLTDLIIELDSEDAIIGEIIIKRTPLIKRMFRRKNKT